MAKQYHYIQLYIPTNGTYSRIDVLQRVIGADEWNMIEVKSSTSLEYYHIDDMSFQYYVFNNAGIKIGKCYIMVIDNKYVRNGDINPHALFRLEELIDLTLVIADMNFWNRIAISFRRLPGKRG